MAETQTTTRKPAKGKGADQDQPQPQQPQPEPTPQPEPEPTKPAAKPTATWELGTVQVPYHHPSIQVGDQTHTCPHTAYGHESEKSARTCALRLAAEAGAVLAK